MNEIVVDGKLALVIQRQRGGVGSKCVKALSGTCWPGCRFHVKILQRVGVLAELRRDLEDDVVLVELGEHDGDQALSEGVVEGVVDGRGRQAEARGGVAIDDQVFLEGVILLVGGDVAQLRQLLQLGDEPRHPEWPDRSGSAASRLY